MVGTIALPSYPLQINILFGCESLTTDQLRCSWGQPTMRVCLHCFKGSHQGMLLNDYHICAKDLRMVSIDLTDHQKTSSKEGATLSASLFISVVGWLQTSIVVVGRKGTFGIEQQSPLIQETPQLESLRLVYSQTTDLRIHVNRNSKGLSQPCDPTDSLVSECLAITREGEAARMGDHQCMHTDTASSATSEGGKGED